VFVKISSSSTDMVVVAHATQRRLSTAETEGSGVLLMQGISFCMPLSWKAMGRVMSKIARWWERTNLEVAGCGVSGAGKPQVYSEISPETQTPRPYGDARTPRLAILSNRPHHDPHGFKIEKVLNSETPTFTQKNVADNHVLAVDLPLVL